MKKKKKKKKRSVKKAPRVVWGSTLSAVDILNTLRLFAKSTNQRTRNQIEVYEHELWTLKSVFRVSAKTRNYLLAFHDFA